MTSQTTTYMKKFAAQVVAINDAYLDDHITQAQHAVAIAKIDHELTLLGATWDDLAAEVA